MKISKYNESQLSIEYLRSQLSYNLETGEFWWKVPAQGRNRSKPAGHISKSTGYRSILIKAGTKTRPFVAHRLAWFYVYGIWPKHYLDHIDRNRSNNHISNLREASHSENQMNRTKQAKATSSFLGVSRRAGNKKWKAQIKIYGKVKHIGCYDSEIEAAIAYNQAATERDQDFKNINQF